MNPGTPREEELFLAAFQLPADSRPAYLDVACSGDAALRARLEALLDAHDQATGALATGAGRTLATIAFDPTDLPPAPVPFGPEIGRYKLLEKLGEGGCGVVYVAEQTEPVRRRVALKVIKLGMDTQAVVARFEAERQALAMMDHPNIAKVLDAGTTDQGRPYFVMELVRGIRITDYCDQNLLPTPERLNLFIKVCQAIQHAHQKGIIHRDIKPSNILVTLHDGVPVPKVIDFGIAKATEGRLTEHTVYTQLHQFIGTPAYMSPEQAEMSGLDIDTRSDIYSLGVLLYELLTGLTPFDSKDLISQGIDAMRRTLREREPARPSTRFATLAGVELTTTAQRRSTDSTRLLRQVQGDLDWIVMKCLEKDRARRYETANGVAADLNRHLHHEPVTARPPSTTYRFQKAWSRNRLVFSAGAAVALTLVAGLAVSLWQAKRAQNEVWKANLSEARALRSAGGSGARVQGSALVQKLLQRPGLTDEQTLNLREEAIAQLALVDIEMPTNWVMNPSDRQLAWNSTLDQFAWSAGSNRVEVREFPSERIVASLSGPPQATFERAVFGRDNQLLAVRFNTARGDVRVWRLNTQELVLETTSADDIYISPDGITLATSQPGGLAVQSLSPGSSARLLQPGRSANRAVFSPDSKRIAVLPGDTSDMVEIWDATTGETLCSFTNNFNPLLIAWHPDGTRLVVGGDRGKLELRALTMSGAGDQCAGPPFSLEGHLGTIRSLQFTPDGTTLLSHAWDSSSIVWDLVSDRPLLREQRMALLPLNEAGDRMVGARESPTSQSVATLIHRTGFRTAAWAGGARPAFGISLSPDGRLGVVSYFAIAGQSQGECLLWDFSSGREIARLKGVCAQFSADSQTLFTFEPYADTRVRSHDVSEVALKNPPTGWSEGRVVYQGRSREQVNTGALSSDGRTLVIAATDAVIFVDTLGQRPTRSWAQPAHVVDLSNDGQWILTTRQNEPTTLRTASNGEAVARFGRSTIGRFSPDNRWVAVVGVNEVSLYSLASIAALQERNEIQSRRPAYHPILLENGGIALSAPLAFSPNSQMFAVVQHRTQVRLYETWTGRELATLSPPNPAPIRGIRALNFSLDGQWLLAAKEDGESVAWNLPLIRSELAKLRLDWKDSQK